MRPRVKALSFVVGLVLGAVVLAPAGVGARKDGPVLVFVSDGMRHDLMLQYAADGLMPNYRRVLKGVQGDHGMIPSVVANSAPGWVTLATGAEPASHGITNNTFHDNTLPFSPFGVSGFTPANNRAQTIAQSAVAEGKRVAALGWVAFDPASIPTNGTDDVVIEYFPDWLTGRGIIANFDVPLQWTNILSLNAFLTSTKVTLAAATGWTNVPASHSPAMETTFVSSPLSYNVYLYDSTNDQRTNYNKVLVSPSKDGTARVAVLGQGDWSKSIPAAVGGVAGGFYVKVIDLTPDLSRFRLYFTPVTRVRAYPASLEDELVARFDAIPPDDFSPYIIGLVDARTHAEQAVRASQVPGLQLYPFVLERYRPDLALVGVQVTDAIQHRFLGLATPGSDGRQYRRLIANAYRSSDRILGAVWDTMDHANVFVTSDHGFSSSSMAINANYLLETAGLYNRANPAAGKAVAYGAGGTAQVYVNLQGRNPGGTVPPDEYDAVQQQIIDAFAGLGPSVVERVLRKDETAAIPTADDVKWNLLDPDRTGDVVVFSAPPYQFDAPSAGVVTAPAPIFGQHGFIPNGDLERYATFAATGPALRKHEVVGPVTARDVAPTVAAILGIDPPAQSDGSVLDILRD
jgi:predicted AlkP superfamily phosphohydrolase/phosphomutase